MSGCGCGTPGVRILSPGVGVAWDGGGYGMGRVWDMLSYCVYVLPQEWVAWGQGWVWHGTGVGVAWEGGGVFYDGVCMYFSPQEWVCEFCGSKNEVDVVPEELPTEADTTYMIAPAPLVGGGAGGGVGMEDSLVIFCIDISGSMCVTTEVGRVSQSY